MKETLAIDGGQPVRSEAFPSGLHGVQDIGEEEKAAVMDVLERQKIFRFLLDDQDSYSWKFEQAYREWTGMRYALAVTGGTTALISALVGLGIGTGDEVIVPGYTYIATAAAVLQVGAIPVIAEIDDTMTLDPVDFEAKITPLTKAVIPVHMRGWPAQMDRIQAVAAKYNIKVLEDVAQANGGLYQGKALGSIGDAGIFSFQHYKIITSGEGGMVVTDDDEVFQRVAFRHDSAMGFWKEGWDVQPFAGENARMCEMRAALGLVQFQRLEGILARTRALKHQITADIADLPGIELGRVADRAGDCGISTALYLPTPAQAQQFAAALKAEGIPSASIYNKGVPNRHIYKYWDYVLNQWTSDRTGYPWARPYYTGSASYHEDMCPNTLDYLSRAVTINVSQAFSEADAADIAAGIRKVALAYA